MDSNLIPNIFAISLFLVTLFVSIRGFYAYFQIRNSRLFILGLSMGVIALTAAADFASSNITTITLNTDWFLYIGQAVSLLFILLSFLRSSEAYFKGLMRWHILVSALLLCFLLLAPTLPDFPNTFVKTLLSGSRSIICFGIFFAYISAFMTKPTRFGLLMSLSFLLLAFGYLVIVQQYFVHDQAFFDNAGDSVRLLGLILLFGAILAG